eukprot:scaffold20641_cov61-Phaeocystis_antarctica.AAC.3
MRIPLLLAPSAHNKFDSRTAINLQSHPHPNPNLNNPNPNPTPDFLKMGANSIGLVAPLFPAGNLLTSSLNPNPHLHPNPNPNRP